MIGHDETVDSGEEHLVIVETNIDDMSPQIYEHVMERAFELGAKDCYLMPVQMKKNRPGVIVSILCQQSELDAMCELLLTETTTLGVRFHEVRRRALEREIVKVETEFGVIDVKVARLNGHVIKAMPEYEQCRGAARERGVALQIVEQAARDSFLKLQSER